MSEKIQINDRCLLISENRPEWLISDLAIMLTKGVTVPAYTTYTERDYEYLIGGIGGDLVPFVSFLIKIVMRSTNVAVAPTFQSLRVIAMST